MLTFVDVKLYTVITGKVGVANRTYCAVLCCKYIF